MTEFTISLFICIVIMGPSGVWSPLLSLRLSSVEDIDMLEMVVDYKYSMCPLLPWHGPGFKQLDTKNN